MFRIGHGYDVHKLVRNRDLIIGGIKIPYTFGFLGHSDGDVLCHAIIDALLGAQALGSIGDFFPDSKEKYKNADSQELLQEIVNLTKKNGYSIVNIDCTIVAQEPKIAPYIDEIKKNISGILETDVTKVSIKATTEENLGFTGRKEGIKTYVVCLIKKDI